MHSVLKDKKFIFFDVGFTLDRPASGDWVLINKFYALAGEKLKERTPEEIRKAKAASARYVAQNHLTLTLDEEVDRMRHVYSILSDELRLGFTAEEVEAVARDRALNMENYIPYPDAVPVLQKLQGKFGLGVISDTWPSIVQQLLYIGVYDFFSTFTFSCSLGILKPDERMYLDALAKSGCPAEETVFIDDRVANLEGAAKLGITPILIAANPESDVPTEFCKIHALSELIQ